METQEAIEVFIRFTELRGEFIQNLRIRNGFFFKPWQLVAILSNCPQLEEIWFEHCYFCEEKPQIQSLPTLSKLKTLIADHSHFGLYDFFVNAPLKIYKVPVTSGHESDQTVEVIKTWKNIESIEINRIAFFHHFQRSSSRTMPFQLKKFCCDIAHLYVGNTASENFIEFIKSNRQTLEELRLENIQYLSQKQQVMQMIFTDLNILRKLTIDFEMLNHFKSDRETFNRLPLVSSLKEIMIYHAFQYDHLDYDETFLNKFPALESIQSDAHLIPSKWLRSLSSINTKLQTIPLISIDSEEAANVKFVDLKVLWIGSIPNINLLMKFLLNNSSIETLRVNMRVVDEIGAEELSTILGMENLKQLTFTGNISVMRKFYCDHKIIHDKSELVEKNSEATVFCFPKSSSSRDRYWKLPKSTAMLSST